MKTAIMTFVVGEQYQKMYDAVFRHSAEVYCKKYNIDLKLITEPIEPSSEKQNLCCQKLIAIAQDWAKEYDAIAWVESDILISPNAPNIFDEVTDDKVLFAHDMAYNDPRYISQWQSDLNINTGIPPETYTDFLKRIGVYIDGGDNINECVNEGVTIFQPKYHAEYYEKMYREHNFKDNQPTQLGRDGTFLATREIWWWYKTIIDGRARFIDSRWNMPWCYYRRIHAEPYGHENELIIHAKNYITHSFFCHIPDRENVNIIDFVYLTFFKNPDITLIVEGGNLGWLLHPIVRAKRFKKIYIVCPDDSAKHLLYSNFPRLQNMNFLPSNLYTFVTSVPDIDGPSIRCSSEMTIESFLKAIHDLS